MSFRGFLRPGQGNQLLQVWTRDGATTASGRPHTANMKPGGTFYGIITQCSPKQIEQFKQNGHPVSHTIVQRGTKNRAKPTDVLEVVPKEDDGASRFFYVETIHDPVEIGHYIVYHVLERNDLQCKRLV